MKRVLLYFLTSIFSLNLSAQEYGSPLDMPLELSANFGEIRTNHFHSGIDLKTGGTEGKNVYAIEDGYISRIYVNPFGFGRALYVSHPSKGTMSVYAHLQSFSPEIAAYVKEEQYRKKSFSVDLHLNERNFTVLKGEKIAKSGNSGSSGGPHLHFEIRNSAGATMNLISENIYSVKDDIAPTIHSVSLVRIDTVKGVPVHTTYKTVKAQKVGSRYKLLSDTLKIAAPTYFVIEVSERKTASTNIFGIYSMIVKRNSEPYFGFEINKFTFDITRYVNTLCKFPETTQNRNDWFRTYVSPNNNLSIYSKVVSNGIIDPESIPLIDTIDVEVYDDSNNSSKLSFLIYGTENSEQLELKSDGTPISWKKGGVCHESDISVSIPANALYDSELITIKKLLKSEKNLTNIYSIGSSGIKLQKSITLNFSTKDIDIENLSKVVVVSIKSGKLTSLGGKLVNGNIEAKATDFGSFSLAIDQIKPTITPRYKSEEAQTNKRYLSFKITDNLSGISSYSATINGEWALLEYDPKVATISHPLKDGIAKKGVNEIVVTVKDGRNNAQTYKGTFMY